MATYRELKGLTVPYLDSDLPSASASTQEGGVWYNSGTGKLRAFVAADTWATSAPVNTGRGELAGAGIQTAALAFGGVVTAAVANSEEYNGAGWAEGNDLNTARYNLGGCGTQTAAFAVAGYTPPPSADLVEEYNGSSWSETTDINTAGRVIGACGITTAALAGSRFTSPAYVANVEQWNGSAWSEVGDVNDARGSYGALAGTSTAALHISQAGPGVGAGGCTGATPPRSWPSP